MIFHGRSVSPGLFEGRAHLLQASGWLETARAIASESDEARQTERLVKARVEACGQLERIENQLNRMGRRADAEIFATHRALMNDPALEQGVEDAIAEGRSAEQALASALGELHDEFSEHASAMIRDKAPDLLDIGQRWFRCLNPEAEIRALAGGPVVLIAAAVSPSELIGFANAGPLAVLTNECGDKSHAAILARSLGIPVLAGVGWPPAGVTEGATILVDADQGIALIDSEVSPDERREIARIRQAISDRPLTKPKPRQPVTQDGTRIRLRLNISDPREAPHVSELGADGVGLFRTEFFYMGRDAWPTEEESYAMYVSVADAVGGASLHIRLADFGADKCPAYAGFPMGRNPSLGLRGVRLLLEREDILHPQVRAISRLAEEHSVVLLVPMLDGLDTLQRLVDSMEAALDRPRAEFPFRLGAMIEVPAAALSVRALLDHIDWLSIGLNDLTQYLMAADREDESVQHHHDPLDPAVLGLVHHVVRAADEREKGVGVCGELAGDPTLAAVLLALGVRDLSVSRADYARTVETIEGLSIPRLKAGAEGVLAARSGREVRELLRVI